MTGKGSAPRPMDIPREEFYENWDRIFGNTKYGPVFPKSKDKQEKK